MSLWSSPCRPGWIVPIVGSGREVQATAWLARHGIEAWYPTEKVYVHSRRPPHILEPKIRSVSGGYLFVKTDRIPVRDFWVARSFGKIMDIFHFGERLVILDDSDFDEMTQIPDRIAAIRQAGADAMAAAAEAARIRPGDTVTILEGSMTGWRLTVEDAHGGIVRLAGPMGVIEVDDSRVEKA